MISPNAGRPELQIPFEILQSRYGTPGPYNAGVLGFLEGAA